MLSLQYEEFKTRRDLTPTVHAVFLSCGWLRSVLIPAVTHIRCEADLFSFKIEHALLPSRMLAASLGFFFYSHNCTSLSQIWLLLIWVYEEFCIRGPAHILDHYRRSILTTSDVESLQVVVQSQGPDSASNYKHPIPTVSRASLHPKVYLWQHMLTGWAKCLILW